MKKFRLIIVLLLIVGLTYTSSISTTVKTEAKAYNAPNGDIVSTRELALLASIVYEDIPNDSKYNLSQSEIDKDNDCFDSNGNFKKNNCFYKTMGTDYVTLKKSKDKVLRYIEGMSERKVNSLVSQMTTSLHEDGEKYYFLNFAHAKELEDSGWKIYDYLSDKKESKLISKIQKLVKDDISFQGVFDVVTFKKGSNYVIAYRGTDYPDLLEWLQDVAYALNGQHAEALMAYTYAQQIYGEIVENDPNAKIYVTGHSLGAYLAQVGGAAIIDKEAGKTYTNNGLANQKQYTSIEEYRDDYYKGKTSRLQQVGYFNGMGIDGIAVANDFSVQTQNALVYLSTYDKNGNLNSTNRNVNYSNTIKSSGRLVLYSMDGDPISSIGFHFGEIYKLETAADAITNHRYTHSSDLGEALPGLLSGLNSLLNKASDNSKFNIAGDLTGIFKDLITSDKTTSSTVLNYLPEYVINSIELETGRAILNYGLGSLLENLTADLENYTSNHGMTNLFDHFNVNHETDSFACIMDTGVGKVTNIDLTISSVGFECDDSTGTCYTNKTYDDKGITYNDLTVTGNYTGNNIMLTASIDSACAKRYIWEYSYDNKNWSSLGTTIDNKIIAPNSVFENSKEGTKTVYFRVRAAYGDTFTELKATFPQDSTEIKYQRTTIYSANPTISEGLNVTTTTTDISNKQLSSPVNKAVTLITDRTAPTCIFEPAEENVKLKCFLGICTKQSIYPKLVCKDNLTGVNDNLTLNNFKTSDTGLIDSIKLTKNLTKNKETNKLTSIIEVSARRVPTSKTPKVTYKGTISDKAGNSRNINTTVKIKIKKK